MMKQRVLLLLFSFFSFFAMQAQSQGTYYGFKGGLTVGIQQWNTFEQDPLIAYHGIFSMESLAEKGKFSLFAQLGYHVKGSAIRNTLFGNPFNGSITRAPPREFKFYNISLSFGAKQRFKTSGNARFYYLFGVRGDYTVDTNLGDYEDFILTNPSYARIYPLNSYDFIRRINYGIIAGGGIEFPLSDFVDGVLEFTANPDFSLQYQQSAIPNVTDPFSGTSRTIPERNIRNLTFEITLGFRFLRRIVYVD